MTVGFMCDSSVVLVVSLLLSSAPAWKCNPLTVHLVCLLLT